MPWELPAQLSNCYRYPRARMTDSLGRQDKLVALLRGQPSQHHQQPARRRSIDFQAKYNANASCCQSVRRLPTPAGFQSTRPRIPCRWRPHFPPCQEDANRLIAIGHQQGLLRSAPSICGWRRSATSPVSHDDPASSWLARWSVKVGTLSCPQLHFKPRAHRRTTYPNN